MNLISLAVDYSQKAKYWWRWLVFNGSRFLFVQVIFYEQDWNPQADKQALQRAHRIGQKSPVLALNLITPNTIEEVSTVKGMMKLTSSNSLISEYTPSTIQGNRSLGAKPVQWTYR